MPYVCNNPDGVSRPMAGAPLAFTNPKRERGPALCSICAITKTGCRERADSGWLIAECRVLPGAMPYVCNNPDGLSARKGTATSRKDRCYMKHAKNEKPAQSGAEL